MSYDSAMALFKLKQKVAWKWAGGLVDGVVEQIFFERVEKMIKGKKIVRNGSTEKPAYLVKSDAGNLALKLETELQARSSARRPDI